MLERISSATRPPAAVYSSGCAVFSKTAHEWITFPNITEKYDSEPLITPAKRTEYRERMGADEVVVQEDLQHSGDTTEQVLNLESA